MKQEKKEFEELKQDFLARCKKGDKKILQKFAEYCAENNFSDEQMEGFWKELQHAGFFDEGDSEDILNVETMTIETDSSVPDSVTMQIREIVQIPRMTPERERELSKTIIEARNELTTANLRLAVYIAKKYTWSGMPLEDLFQAGNMGLMKAAMRYNYQVGTKFATYAVPWIRQSISKAIVNESKLIRVSEHGNSENRKREKAIEKLVQKLHRDPSDEEVAKELGWDIKKVRQLKTAFHPISPLHARPTEDGEALIDRIPDKNTPSLEENAERALINQDLQMLAEECLTRQEQIVLDLIRLGYTEEEIAEAVGTSVVRVRQVEFGAWRKIGDYRNGGVLEKRFLE